MPESLLNFLLSIIPLVSAGAATAIVSAVRKVSDRFIDPKWIPAILPIAGGILGFVAHIAGVDVAILESSGYTPEAWTLALNGVMAGLAAVGVHQIKKQASSKTDVGNETQEGV